MIPAQFDYLAPTSVDEVLAALADAGSAGTDVKLLGGGQSLMPVLRMRLAAPELVVDLSNVEGLRGVREDGDALVIGAMTTHDDVTRDPLVRRHALLLALATQTVADPQVRHRGTFGGARVHADPAEGAAVAHLRVGDRLRRQGQQQRVPCLLYTSDAADDLLCVDLGGR